MVGASDGKANHAEALAVATLLSAAIEQTEYVTNDEGSPTSFGVISFGWAMTRR